MAIKIKKSQNVSQSYYKLDDRSLSNGTEAGSKSKSKDNSSLFRKMTKYSHNILKSTKNLTFDIVGTQVSNIKDIKEQIVEVAAETTEESKKTIGDLVAFGKKTFTGGGKSLKDKTKDALKEQKDDILKRLKSGKIYMTDSERQEEQMSKEFGDDFDFSGDNFDFGGEDFNTDMSDSFMSTSENDTLPDEPFSAPVRKGTVHYINVSAERRQRLAKSNVKRGGSSHKRGFSGGVVSSRIGELRLGDELVSETTSQVGQSLIEQNEELWARSFAAEENRFGKLIGYQSTIVSSLNSLVEFNTSVVGENIKAQMEYQAKAMASQEDMLSLTKELKDAIIAVGTYKPPEFKDKNLLSGNRLNSKEYANVIKSNIGDLLSSSGLGGLGMILGMTPMLTDNSDMLKGMFDPINTILKFTGNSLLSTKTRAKAFQLNRTFGNFGASFLNRMNELSQYGKGFGKILGTALGDRTTKITQANLGLSSPNAVVGWTSKSDTTLNTVIPMYLSKILAATSGGEEIHWDYKSGRFNTKSAMREKYESERALAYTNATITSYSTNMLDAAQQKGSFSEEQRDGVEKALTKINQNIVKSKIPVRLDRLINDEDYRDKLKSGVDPKYAEIALGTFIDGFQKMSTTERETLNGIGYGTASRNVQRNLNKISRDALEFGGAGALSEFSLEYEAAELAEEINNSRKYDISSILDKNGNLIKNADRFDPQATGRAFAKAEAIIQLARMLPSVDNPKSIKAVEDLLKKEFGVEDVEGIDINDLMKKAQKLKTESSERQFNQKLRAQAIEMNLPSIFFGTGLEGNFVDKSMSGMFDFMGGMYSNLMGDYEAGGEGLRESSDIGSIAMATNDLIIKRLNPIEEKIKSSKIPNKAKTKMLNNIQRLKGNLNKTNESLNANLDQYESNYLIRNVNNLPPTKRAFMKALIGSFNKHIDDTGYYRTIEKDENEIEQMKPEVVWKQFISLDFDGVEEDVANVLSNMDGAMNKIISFVDKHPQLQAFLVEAYNAHQIKKARKVRYKQKRDEDIDELKAAYGPLWNELKNDLKKLKNNPEERKRFIALVIQGLKETGIYKNVLKGKNKIENLINLFGINANSIINSVSKGFKDGRNSVKGKGDNNTHKRRKTKNGNKSQHFADGGIVNGVDTGEDKVDAKLKPGEMVLTKEQQKKLYEISNSGGQSFQSSIERLGITYRDVSDSIKENGLADTLALYRDEIARNKHVKTFITRVGKLIGGTKYKFQGYGDVISLGGVRRGISNGLGVAGAAAGGLIGSMVGHPVLGAALGGGALKKISGIFKMKYPKLKGSLLAAGYADAVKMNKTDLYALITSMALSKDPYEKEKGKALIETDEFKELEDRVNNKNGWDKFVDKVKGIPKALKNGVRDLKLIFHRTIKYKDVVNALDSRFTDYGVTSYDKASLYALVQALPEKTEADKKFKAAIMGMEGYKKLDKDVSNYLTVGQTIKEAVKDVPKKFVRAFRYGKLFKYRNLAKIYMNVEDMDEKEFLNTTKDPADLYAALLTWEHARKGNRKNIFKVLSKQKAFMNLEIANAKLTGDREGKSEDEINKEINEIKSKYKNRNKFAGVISILKSANRDKNPPDFDNLDPSDLYAHATALIEKGGKLGKALANSGQYKLLETTVNGKSDPVKYKGVGNKIKGWLNENFGTKFNTSSEPDLGNSADYSKMDPAQLKYQKRLDKYIHGLMKKGIKGKERDKLIKDWKEKHHPFANGGIVSGPASGDHVGIVANGGEMMLNKNTQLGLFGWLKSLGGGGNKENVNIANKALSGRHLKLSNIIKGDADQAAKKAVTLAGPFAGMISLLSSMNRTMASTLKVLGGNDEGEIDEKNKETIAGQIGFSSNEGGSDGGKDKKLSNKFKLNLPAIAATVMASMTARSGIKKLQRIKSDGFEGLLEKESDSAYNADGSRKSQLQRALDRGGDASNRAIMQSVVQKFGMTAAEKAAGKSVGGFAAVVKAAKNSAKTATKSSTDLLTKNLKGIEDTLIKFIQDPKIIKKLPKSCLNGIKKLPSFLKEIPKRIANFAKNGIKQSAKNASNALKSVPMAGWIAAIASVVWDVANALNDAPRYFHVAPKDVTAGMRATAGIVGGIKSLIVNLLAVTGVGAIIGVGIDMIIPTGWLVEKIYGLIAGSTAKEELAEKQQKQKDIANQLGVDSDKLTEAQNNSLFSKMGSGIHAAFSSKSYTEIQEEKTLKKLNKGRGEGEKITTNEYRNATGTGDIIKKIKGLDGKSSLDKYNEVARVYELALDNGDATTVEKMVKAAKEKDKNVPFLSADTSTLTSSFRAKWEKLLNDPEIIAAGIRPSISGTRRALATQMALYSKGRGDRTSIDKAVKAAGQSAGANFWGNIDDPVTWTLKSNHLGGNALDINTSNLSSDQLALLGKVAAKYGIEWGGNWDDAHKDYPHFEDAKPTQYLARGGLVGGRLSSWGDKVRARLNPGEMVLNRVQQTALFNKIKSFEHDLGMAGLSAVGKLKESPLLTNAKMDIKMIQEAINIQQAIYAEQRRHNDVAEKFFNAVLSLMSGASAPVRQTIPVNSDNEDVSELLRGAAKLATSF